MASHGSRFGSLSGIAFRASGSISFPFPRSDLCSEPLRAYSPQVAIMHTDFNLFFLIHAKIELTRLAHVCVLVCVFYYGYAP